jgi:flavin reductase (DIM6/NTAB) family NADH-FMN oxidoreductase RutF
VALPWRSKGSHDGVGDVDSVLGRLVADLDYPMYVVTASAGEDRAGCLVGFVTQAGIDPPRLLVMLSKQNETYRVAQRTDVLGVHFLGQDDADLAALFGEESGDWTDKFGRCEWQPASDGTPILSGVRGWLTGRVLERLDCGDHVAHLLEPIDAGGGGSGDPLSFQQLKGLDPGHPA